MASNGIRRYQEGRIPDEKFGTDKHRAFKFYYDATGEAPDYSRFQNKPRAHFGKRVKQVDIRDPEQDEGRYYLRPWFWGVIVVILAYWWMGGCNAAIDRDQDAKAKLFIANTHADTMAWQSRFMQCTIERNEMRLLNLAPWEFDKMDYMRKNCMHIKIFNRGMPE